jgi:hypothetical protein
VLPGKLDLVHQLLFNGAFIRRSNASIYDLHSPGNRVALLASSYRPLDSACSLILKPLSTPLGDASGEYSSDPMIVPTSSYGKGSSIAPLKLLDSMLGRLLLGQTYPCQFPHWHVVSILRRSP